MPFEKDSQTPSDTSPERCSSNALRSFSLNSSWLIAVREIPTTANSSGNLRWAARSYRAGTSLRAVRSPEAPKITMTPGSGTRGSLCSSRKTFFNKASGIRHQLSGKVAGYRIQVSGLVGEGSEVLDERCKHALDLRDISGQALEVAR